MASDADNLANHTLEWMKRVGAKLDLLTLEIGDLKSRVSAVEDISSTVSHRVAGVEVQMTNLIKRIDRIDGRLERIDRRLELRDEADDD